MLAVSTIKGGIRVGKAKDAANGSGDAKDDREPALAGKG
jgi:hypothetical protein